MQPEAAKSTSLTRMGEAACGGKVKILHIGEPLEAKSISLTRMGEAACGGKVKILHIGELALATGGLFA